MGSFRNGKVGNGIWYFGIFILFFSYLYLFYVFIYLYIHGELVYTHVYIKSCVSDAFPISAPVRANEYVSDFGTGSREQTRFGFRNEFARTGMFPMPEPVRGIEYSSASVAVRVDEHVSDFGRGSRERSERIRCRLRQ